MSQLYNLIFLFCSCNFKEIFVSLLVMYRRYLRYSVINICLSQFLKLRGLRYRCWLILLLEEIFFFFNLCMTTFSWGPLWGGTSPDNPWHNCLQKPHTYISIKILLGRPSYSFYAIVGVLVLSFLLMYYNLIYTHLFVWCQICQFLFVFSLFPYVPFAIPQS